jgi:hypothetical protein
MDSAMREWSADSLYVELAYVKNGNFSPNVTSDDLTHHFMYVVITRGDLASSLVLIGFNNLFVRV